jgi:hypothetical protein
LAVVSAWLLFAITTRAIFTSVAMLGLALSVAGAIVRPNRTAVLLAMVGLALGIVWILAWLAESTDFRDADGWVDCWPTCNAVQTATGALFTYGTVALATVGVVSFASLVRRHRGTR